jgi:ankyrin repeat protein
VAAACNRLQIVHMLIDAGANVDKGKTDGAFIGTTPLFMAARTDHLQVMQALIGAGAGVEQGNDAWGHAAHDCCAD